MTPLLSLVILILISYLGSVFFQKVELKQSWLKSFAYTGSLYVVLGYGIGPQVLNLLNSNILKELHILLVLVLGWAGFLIGLQTNTKNLKRFQKHYYTFSTTNLLFTLIVSFLLLVLFTLLINPANLTIEHLMVLAIAGSITSPIMLGVVMRERKISGRLGHILQFSAAYDNLIGLFLLGFLMAFYNNVVLLNSYEPGIEILFYSSLVGLVVAQMYTITSRQIKGRQEDVTLLIGSLVFAVGVSFYLDQSVLFMSFVLGAWIANKHDNIRKIYLEIQEFEKPLYILLLIFVGANLNIMFDYSWIFLIVFLFIHFISKIIAGRLAVGVIKKQIQLSRSIGLATSGFGGLSLAVALDFHISEPSKASSLLLFTLVISLFIYDVISLYYLENKLTRTAKTV